MALRSRRGGGGCSSQGGADAGCAQVQQQSDFKRSSLLATIIWLMFRGLLVEEAMLAARGGRSGAGRRASLGRGKEHLS